MRIQTPLAAGLALLVGSATASAASCREQLQDFERRLYESSLAYDDPERYAELSRQVEEISELRDETLCARRLAELGDQLPAAEATTAELATDRSQP